MIRMRRILVPARNLGSLGPLRYSGRGTLPVSGRYEARTARRARAGINGWKRTSYGGPAPPTGRHRYFHRLYALDVVLPDLEYPAKARLLNAMKGRVLAEAQLIGTYQMVR